MKLKNFIEDTFAHAIEAGRIPNKYLKYEGTDREQFVFQHLKETGNMNDCSSYNPDFVYNIMKDNNIEVDLSNCNNFAYSLIRFSEGKMTSVGVKELFYKLTVKGK